MSGRERIFVALDTAEIETATSLADRLRGEVGAVKVGLQLFTAHGGAAVAAMRARGHRVFLDLKLHDIPNTVAGAAEAAGASGVSWLTAHALGGEAMLRQAVEAAAGGAAAAGHSPPTVLAVTVLTSHDEAQLETLGLAGPCAAAVARLAGLARDAGCGGVVCSAEEIRIVREAFPAATLVVPGIRPVGTGLDDQARVATPRAAIERGADRLVIGRPITRAGDPAAAARAIAAEIDG